MGSGNKTTSTTTQSNPMMNDVLGSAKTVFQNGSAWAPNTASMVAPFSEHTTGAWRGMQNTANMAVPAFQNNFNQVSNLANQGGYTQDQNAALNQLRPMASGSMMQGNPFLDSIIQKNAGNMGDAINLQASGMGRTASGANQQVLAREIGDMANQARFNNYNTERGYMQDAIGSLFNAGQTQQQNIRSNADALANAYNARMMPEQTFAGIGAQTENKAQQYLQDQARIFQEQKNAQTDPLNWLAGLANGGQQVTTQQVPRNGWQQGIGGGLAAFGATGNPLMGLLGGLGGIFG